MAVPGTLELASADPQSRALPAYNLFPTVIPTAADDTKSKEPQPV